MKLQKLVKEIYERFSVITVKEVHLSSYAEYFIPFTNQWLDDCSTEYCKYVEKSYFIDEQEQFARTNEYVKFSSSVIDLFDMLNQLGASTSKLRSGRVWSSNKFWSNIIGAPSYRECVKLIRPYGDTY